MKIYSPLRQTYSPTVMQKSISKKWTNIQEASGYSTTPNAARTMSYRAWNSPVEYHSCDFYYCFKWYNCTNQGIIVFYFIF